MDNFTTTLIAKINKSANDVVVFLFFIGISHIARRDSITEKFLNVAAVNQQP